MKKSLAARQLIECCATSPPVAKALLPAIGTQNSRLPEPCSEPTSIGTVDAADIVLILMPGDRCDCDGVWAYTGTGNFDNLSLRHNRELGLAINEGPVIEEIEQRLFQADMQDEWELTEPLPVGPLDYLAEFLASTFT
jgi:hypothetical protein